MVQLPFSKKIRRSTIQIQWKTKTNSLNTERIERFRITLMANNEREFVPRDQVFSLLVFYC